MALDPRRTAAPSSPRSATGSVHRESRQGEERWRLRVGNRAPQPSVIQAIQRTAGNAAVSQLLSGPDDLVASVQRIKLRGEEIDTTRAEGRMRLREALEQWDDIAEVRRLRTEVEQTHPEAGRDRTIGIFDDRIQELQRKQIREDQHTKRRQERAEREQEAERDRAAEQQRRDSATELEASKQGEIERLGRFVVDAESLVGPLRKEDGKTPQDDDRVNALFALALAQVRDRAEPLIQRILQTVHRSRDALADGSGFTLVLLNGTAMSAASGERATGSANYAEVRLAVDLPSVIGSSTPLLSGVRSRRDLEEAIIAMRESSQELASTILHEFTHLALHRAFNNASLPYPAADSADDDERTPRERGASTVAGKADRDAVDKAVAELEEFGRSATDDAASRARAVARRILEYLPRVRESQEYRRATEVVSHLMEIAFAEGMPFVKARLPAGAHLLEAVNTRFEKLGGPGSPVPLSV
ncbi:hypothetical protein GE115_02865 [Agromyces sp. CFH 90414]|uniref:Uncharacterized protein n=1 Tax=Agromyces agglutinans TaxID=2662258 RepID=A0A6I2F516_9MICO|nr:hypothetical protein [Agromyces agglutinans]MRG58817.1 hypothetical protein [Agromyces agglutinans]